MAYHNQTKYADNIILTENLEIALQMRDFFICDILRSMTADEELFI